MQENFIEKQLSNGANCFHRILCWICQIKRE